MPYYLNGELVTTHAEFESEVNKYSTEWLLKLIALICSKHATWDDWIDPEDKETAVPMAQGVTPWALAHIARTTLLNPRKGVRMPLAEDVVRLCSLYLHIREPVLTGRDDSEALLRLSIRLAQEQLPYQSDMAADLARATAILLHTDFPAHRTSKFIRPGWDESVFGMPFKQYVNMIYGLWMFVLARQGQFRTEWLSEDEHSFLSNYFDLDAATRLIAKDWTLQLHEFAAVNERMEEGTEEPYRKYEVNPLWTKPFVCLSDGLHVAPVPN